MFELNKLREHRLELHREDEAILDAAAADEAARFLALRENNGETPLHSLPALAAHLGVCSLHVKDEGLRLDLGSFKALGGAYAVIRLVLEEASRRLERPIAVEEFRSDAVRAVAATMTVACATDGNHGRSVAQGAQLIGANAAIFVHAGVSDQRVAAIGRYGAEMIRVEGNYDDSVAYASRVANERDWIIVSDTSWPGYERIPGLVMQGYTALVRETLDRIPEPPTHVFLQAGVGGFAAAVAGHMALVLGEGRPRVIVVEPSRAACVFESARAGTMVKVADEQPTVMAMLECYEPSLVAWRILARVADAFMTVEDDDAVTIMNRLARPLQGDPAIVAGESGGVGLAGLVGVLADDRARDVLELATSSRVLVVNTEGATDPDLYRQLVGMSPAEVLAPDERAPASA